MSHTEEVDHTDYEATLKPIPEAPAKVHYVDNDEMLAAYIVFQEKRKEHKEKGLPEPEIPRYICECLMKICHHTAYKYNFINYSFREEMILDAIENCIKGVNMFDVNRKYIFSYYTTAAWNSFVRRIKLEERQSRIKGKLISEMDVETLVVQEHDNGDFQIDYANYMKEAGDYTASHEKHYKSLSKEDKDETLMGDDNALVFDEGSDDVV